MALIICPECGKEISDKAASCPNCGMPLLQATAKPEPVSLPNEDLLYCPKCKSTNLHVDKKGFSGGKALAGAVVAGGIGMLAGTIGSHNIDVTCLTCGHKFNPVKDLKKRKQEYERTRYREIKRKQIANPTALEQNIWGEVLFFVSLILAVILLFIPRVSLWWSILSPIVGLILGVFIGSIRKSTNNSQPTS